MASKKDPEKEVTGLPPTGSRNPDPITNAPGSHPIETGIGAAVGGAATGAAVGTVAGPIGTAVGAAVGAVAGGYAGKGVGEMIDPTTEDNWLREISRVVPMSNRARPLRPTTPHIATGPRPNRDTATEASPISSATSNVTGKAGAIAAT